MPKYTPRAPGQPLPERPWEEPHIPEMSSRTLFRESPRRQRPRVSLFTEENMNHTHTPTYTPSYTVSPEDEPRAPGIVSPVSPLTLPFINPPVPAIEINPATPSSELGPKAFRHWYFDNRESNHYHEKHASMGSDSDYTMLCLGREVRRGRWSLRRSLRRSVKGVREWVRERRAWKAERARERVVVGGEGQRSVGSNVSEKEQERKGARCTAKDLVRKGTNKLRKLTPGSEDVPVLPKEIWKPMKRS